MTGNDTDDDGASDTERVDSDDDRVTGIYDHVSDRQAAGHDHGSSGDGHSHGHGAAADPETWYGQFRQWVAEWFHGLYHGMIEHPAFEKIEKEAEDIEDVFLFACFSDAFGIPSPVSYYTVELLPYLVEEFEQWERRMWDRESLLERKGQQYHFH
jgi:hypothetical protein